jgi:pantothenate kinase
MAPNPLPPIVAPRYLTRVRLLLEDGRRKLLGLVGPPGSGKSTLSLALHQAFADVSQVVPMDGFHLANVELRRLGSNTRKGAPDTFDSAGYVTLLRRLRMQGDEIVYAPEFRREIEEPIAGAIPILPRTQLVITEGNYLLLNQGPWADVAGLLDDLWYLEIDAALRTQRLTQRHVQFGRSPQDAAHWVGATDEPNARLVEETKRSAKLVFRWDD